MWLLVSVWSIDALRNHFEIRITDVQAQLDRRVAELHREHDKFERATRDGFVKQNEFRGSLEDLGKQMATRRELETLEENLNKRLYRIENNQARIAGALLIVGVVLPLAAALVFHLLTK